MRFGEECPYITPCGWCSRKNAPCDNKSNKKAKLPKSGANVPMPQSKTPEQKKQTESALYSF